VLNIRIMAFAYTYG